MKKQSHSSCAAQDHDEREVELKVRFSGNLGPCVAARCQQGGCRKGAVPWTGLCRAVSQKASLGALVTGEAAELSVAGLEGKGDVCGPRRPME